MDEDKLEAIVPKKINVGDKFTIKGDDGAEFERIEDDPNPVFECERMRVKAKYKYAQGVHNDIWESVFPAEPEWWNQRGLIAEPQEIKHVVGSLSIICSSCGDVCEIQKDVLIGLESVDQIEPYICDACENQRDLEADEDDHECPCGCEGDDSRCVYALSYNDSLKQKLTESDNFFVNSRGDWECVHCGTSALMFESVHHNAQCPALIQQLTESIAAAQRAGASDADPRLAVDPAIDEE